MIVLNTKKISQYLEKISPNLDFKVKKIISCEEFDQYSNASWIFKVSVLTDRGDLTLFIKQVRPFNKRAKKIGKIIKSDPERMKGEVKLIELLSRIWGTAYVPEIYYFDESDKILILSDVSENDKILIEEFAKNRIHPELGTLLGNLMGKLHNETYKTKETIAGSLAHEKHMLRLLKQHYGFGIKKFVSKKTFDDFFKISEKSPHSIIWNDPVFRNIFVKDGSVSMVDFDSTINFDPAVDNGMLIAHWVWMMLKGDKKLEKDSQIFIQDYMKNYKKQLKEITKQEENKILERTIAWLGVYLVSRTDGKSGSYFKKYPKWEQKIRQTGIDLFSQKETLTTAKIKSLLGV